MRQYNVGAPLERIAIDVMSPLPTSTVGNKYILVIGDYFTWIYLSQSFWRVPTKEDSMSSMVRIYLSAMPFDCSLMTVVLVLYKLDSKLVP
jgi:hypothetical protein